MVKKKILVAEDERNFIFLKKSLDRKLIIETAFNGEEIIEKIKVFS